MTEPRSPSTTTGRFTVDTSRPEDRDVALELVLAIEAEAEAALRARLAAEVHVTAVAHHLLRAGWFRGMDRAREEAARLILTAQTGLRYDLDDEYLTPDQRAAVLRVITGESEP